MTNGTGASAFRLTVLNPGGRDPAQTFADGAGTPGQGHQPTNFHGYAACTGGAFHSDTTHAIAEETPVLLLLRGDFHASECALQQLKKAGRTVAVSLKETGLHQIADQLFHAKKLARFLRLVRSADGCLAATPEAADLFRSIRSGEGRVSFIPTPYPLHDARWDFARPLSERAGIFIGTREFDVPSRNHLAALLLARELSEQTGESVTVYNLDGRTGARLLDAIGFDPAKLTIKSERVPYPDLLREIAAHKIVLQCDTSFVPGQVAGDAALGRVPCVGGNGAIDRLAFADLCGHARSGEEIARIARRLLVDREAYEGQVRAIENVAAPAVSFAPVAEQLHLFFGGLD